MLLLLIICLIHSKYNNNNLVALELSPKLDSSVGFQSILAGVVSMTSSTVLISSCPPVRLHVTIQLHLVDFGDLTSF